MARVRDTDYAYAVGRIRAIEKKLLDVSKYERMIEARSPEEAVKLLVEAGYGQLSSEIANSFDYEKILRDEHVKLFKLLKEIAPEPEILDMFLLADDYYNAKVLLKAELSGIKDYDDLLLESGSIGVEKLESALRDRRMEGLPPTMREAVAEAFEAVSRSYKPQSVDLILDKALYIHMKKIAEQSSSDFIKQLIDMMIDLVNLKVFLRVSSIGRPAGLLDRMLIPGGKIPLKLLSACVEAPLEKLQEELKSGIYGPLLEQCVESSGNFVNISKFEKLSDNLVISFVRKAKYKAFGIEPLVGYLVAKEMEIRNVRVIMVGKINNIPAETIRERLRESYV